MPLGQLEALTGIRERRWWDQGFKVSEGALRAARKALKGSAGKMMRELGKEPSVRSIAGEYLRLIDGFVIDREDEIFAESVRSLGIAVRPTATVMRTIDDRVSLAQATLDFAAGIRATRVMEAE